MARIRSVKPATFASYTLAKLPIEARYLFIGLWTEADDEGRLIDSAKKLAGAIFPHDKKVTEVKVEQWLTLLADEGVIQRFTSGNGQYISIPAWEEHQRISHPTASSLPAPTEEFAKNSGAIRETFVPDKEKEKEKEKEASLEGEFVLFYEIYPRHTAVVAARKAFKAARERTDLKTILEGAKRYRDDPTRKPDFTAHPATWLNGDRWADEAVASQQPAPKPAIVPKKGCAKCDMGFVFDDATNAASPCPQCNYPKKGKT